MSTPGAHICPTRSVVSTLGVRGSGPGASRWQLMFCLHMVPDYRDRPLPVGSQLEPSGTRLPVHAAKLLILRSQAVFWEFLLNQSARRMEVLHTTQAPSGSAQLAMVSYSARFVCCLFVFPVQVGLIQSEAQSSPLPELCFGAVFTL